MIVELSSNCLCDPHLGVFTFVSKLLEYATFLQTQLNVRIVAFSQILHRAESAQPFDGYNNKKVQVGKDQEKAQSEKDSHSKNRGGKKPNNKALIP